MPVTRNQKIADTLSLFADLLVLHDESSFKSKAYSTAAASIKKEPEDILSMSPDDWEKIPGVGKGICQKINEIKNTGEIAELSDLKAKTPLGVLELLQIRGLGPSKTLKIWRELGIESPGELEYACLENRLTLLKGFGEKTQKKILENLSFYNETKGSVLFGKLEPLIPEMEAFFTKIYGANNWAWAGEIAYKSEIVSTLEITAITNETHFPEKTFPFDLPLHILGTTKELFDYDSWKNSCHKEHLKIIKDGLDEKKPVDVYNKIGLPVIVPEMRDSMSLEDIKDVLPNLKNLIQQKHIQGAIHLHSTWSDGQNTIQEMAQECQKQGLAYMGICDHSKSAFYANGLSIERVIKQHEEIDLLNKENPNILIVKGIECDILTSGLLDYDEETLKLFDFVVASVHSNLGMDEAASTNRLIKAIENPYTRVLGHPTGRLLLSRKGYPVDMKKIIDACAENNVAIELNANPYRLDIDWRWLPHCIKKNVLVSINTDAHNILGLADIRFGVTCARKGGLALGNCLNAKSLPDFLEWLNAK